MPDSLATRLQKQAIREELLARWDVKIPVARVQRLSLAQLRAIKKVLVGEKD